MTDKYQTFIKIVKTLNDAFSIEPVVYGSFGLYTLINLDKESDDIDLLVPKEFLDTKGKELTDELKKIGFSTKDQASFVFSNREIEVSFESDENLPVLIGANAVELNKQIVSQAIFKELSLRQYLRFYEKMSEDEERRARKGDRDLEKIELIKQEMIAG